MRLTFATRPAKVDNIGRLPMAWVDPDAADSRTVVASGPGALAEYQRALDEWRLLTGAALVGLVEETMTIAAEFAKTRYTLGVPISTLQAISHPLANIAITVQGGRNLARRAAWFLDNEPDERPELAPSVFVFMAEEAAKAATMAVQIQGGLGVSAEAAATAYLVRARGWALAGGDPGRAPSTSPKSWRRAKEPSEWISHESNWPTTSSRFSPRRGTSSKAKSPRTSYVVIARPATTSTRVCTWRWAPPVTWRATGSRNPRAASTACGGASGNWRSDAPTCRG